MPPETRPMEDLEKDKDDSGARTGQQDRRPPAPSADPDPDPDPAFLVTFAPGDADDPRNFGAGRKVAYTLLFGLLAFAGSLGSSIVTPAQAAIAADLGMTHEATVLLMALYVLGFALGPLVWAPVSEAWGRRASMLPALAVLALFSVGSAASRTPAALLATRFFGGVFGSAPISNVSAALGDLYAPTTRGAAMASYSLCVLGGAVLAPVAGAAVVASARLSWRWTLYVEAMAAAAAAATAAAALPETYAPVLLARKAAARRAATGDGRPWHPHERLRLTARTVATKHLGRPLRLFATEPIVACVAAYASFVYGLVFMVLELEPLVFREMRGRAPVVAALPLVALFVGAVAAVGINLANEPRYRRALAAAQQAQQAQHPDRPPVRAVPEARLPPVVLGGVLFAAGVFWFGWTAAPRFHWLLPTAGLGLVGCGFNVVFQQSLNYLVDAYGAYAASATSANTVLRSLLACALPLAARPMLAALGPGPAASVLGGVACLLVPVPVLFLRYGPRLRARSRFAE